MRITGIHVGTQGFTEYLLNLGVSSLPLVDLTGRHTTSSTGVTISGNVAVYNGGSTSYTTVSGSDLDFNWATSFYVVGVFTLSSLAGYQTLWDTHEGLNYTSPQRFGVFTNPDGHLSLSTIMGLLSLPLLQVWLLLGYQQQYWCLELGQHAMCMLMVHHK